MHLANLQSLEVHIGADMDEHGQQLARSDSMTHHFVGYVSRLRILDPDGRHEAGDAADSICS